MPKDQDQLTIEPRNKPAEPQYEDLPPPPKYESSLGALRKVLFGSALSASHAGHQKLPKFLALPIFSSDALSSVAYATEAILGVLALTSTAAMHQSVAIAIAICLLIIVVTASYRQVIFAYPNGGGAYPVGKENLGTTAALVAGASLLVDYVLTVAVSVASGVDAISSFSSDNRLGWIRETGFFVHAHTVEICIFCTLLIMVANLRGVKESGMAFAFPAYVFILSFVVMIIVGSIGYFTHHLIPPTELQWEANAKANGIPVGMQVVGWYMLLQAFSSGCTALTGLEAISNTTPLFREPRDKNAATTMSMMAGIAVFFFFGITWLADVFRTVPIDSTSATYQTIISQLGHQIFDSSFAWWFYYVVQISTAIILILAANTAFAGFPQLASMLAKDRFLPRQLASIGDRLVYANGIVVLAVMSCVLIVVFRGNVYELIPLYAVGVFTSFTIAQAGMVTHWYRAKTKNWQMSLLMNGVGALATAAVAMIFVVSKWDSGVFISSSLTVPLGGVFDFTYNSIHHIGLQSYRHWQFTHPGSQLAGFVVGPTLEPRYGAWLVVVLIPLLVAMFRAVEAHYIEVKQQLTLTGYQPTEPSKKNIAIVLIPGLHRGIVDALRYAQLVSNDVRAVYVEIDDSSTPPLREHWEEWSDGVPLLILASPFRSLRGPMLRYVDAVQRESKGATVTVVLPEFVSDKWWHGILHNQAGLLLKLAFAGREGIVVSNVRYFLHSKRTAAAR
jgi:amino acid transporter